MRGGFSSIYLDISIALVNNRMDGGVLGLLCNKQQDWFTGGAR